jgi:hypothetical protein
MVKYMHSLDNLGATNSARAEMGMTLVKAYAARCDPSLRPHFRAIMRLFHYVEIRLVRRHQDVDVQQWWSDRAEEWLKFAWLQFEAVKSQVESRGGPGSARIT